MAYISLRLPPGISNNGTPYQNRGRWVDCNFVRWVEGVAQPIGRWRRITTSALGSKVSGLHALRDNRNLRYLAIGTAEGVLLLESSEIMDLTPSGYTGGREYTIPGLGYGSGEYNEDAYNETQEGATAILLEANIWTFDNWGEFLMAVSTSDGRLWYWRPPNIGGSGDSELQLVPNAPINNRSLLVTQQRHVMLIGADDDPRLLVWSDREDYTTWTPTPTNRAGDLQVQTEGTLQRALNVGPEILLLSDLEAYRINYVGVPLIYGYEQIGSNCGVLGPHAVVAATDFAVWMGSDGFYVYQGQVTPLECSVRDWVFRDLNLEQGVQVVGAHNSAFAEVWWYFPVRDDHFNSRYVVWNYRENLWYTGYLARDAMIARGVWPTEVGVGRDGHLYEHEINPDEQGLEPRSRPYLQSAPYELGNGDEIAYITQLIPDADSRSLDALEYRFSAKAAPRADEFEFGPYHPNASGFTHCRFAGRQIALRVEAAHDIDWRLGVLRADARPGGGR